MRLKEDIEFDTGYMGKKHPESVVQMQAWREFCKLPAPEQEKRRKAWEAYYVQVKDSPIYALFQEQREALKKRDIAKVKSLAQQARKMRANGHNAVIEKPKFLDPWEFDRGWVNAYQNLDAALKNLQFEVPDEEEMAVWK